MWAVMTATGWATRRNSSRCSGEGSAALEVVDWVRASHGWSGRRNRRDMAQEREERELTCKSRSHTLSLGLPGKVCAEEMMLKLHRSTGTHYGTGERGREGARGGGSRNSDGEGPSSSDGREGVQEWYRRLH